MTDGLEKPAVHQFHILTNNTGDTCEGDLCVAVHSLFLDAVLVRFGASSRSLHVAEVLPPPLTPGVLLQPLLFGSPVLEPDLEGRSNEMHYSPCKFKF